MLKFSKDKLAQIYLILLLVVIAANISDWFINYSSETNQIINAAMFSLIGIAYLTLALAFEKTVLKITIAACGLYLIGMNFVTETTWVSIVGIVCLVVPMIIGKILPDDEEVEITNETV